MDRSVSSIRMLIDIERSEWKDFRKELCKEDKQRFDGLFSVPKLYHHASSNSSNITTIEPIILSHVQQFQDSSWHTDYIGTSRKQQYQR
jgi:hypothetical protein